VGAASFSWCRLWPARWARARADEYRGDLRHRVAKLPKSGAFLHNLNASHAMADTRCDAATRKGVRRIAWRAAAHRHTQEPSMRSWRRGNGCWATREVPTW
jgi:hypothetical protein